MTKNAAAKIANFSGVDKAGQFIRQTCINDQSGHGQFLSIEERTSVDPSVDILPRNDGGLQLGGQVRSTWPPSSAAAPEELFPRAVPAALRRARVVTEHGATFSAVRGVDRWRPGPVPPLSNLLFAGDWTSTGWPATMEGAVRSGYLAAEAILRRSKREGHLVQADL